MMQESPKNKAVYHLMQAKTVRAKERVQATLETIKRPYVFELVIKQDWQLLGTKKEKRVSGPSQYLHQAPW